MKQALPFLVIGLVSFGATHVILTARAAAMRPTASLTVARLAPAAPAAAAIVLPPCRPVRVVYAGSVRPAGDPCGAEH